MMLIMTSNPGRKEVEAVPVRSVTPEGDHEVRLTTVEWLKIIGVLAGQFIGFSIMAVVATMYLERRLTALEINQINVSQRVERIDSKLDSLRN